jgi:hypothetical protein
MTRYVLIICGSLLLNAAVPVLPVEAQGAWRIVKLYLKSDVTVVRETKDTLVLFHPGLQDTLVLTIGRHSDADIYGLTERRRGSNPHRIWVATGRFWNNPGLPQKSWGRFFHAAFLRLIRPPPYEQ